MKRRTHLAAGRVILVGSIALGCDDPVVSDAVVPRITTQMASAVDLLAADSFSRADGSLGANWSRGGGDFADLQIVSQAVQGSTADRRNVAFYNTVTWPSDQWSEVRVASLVGSRNGGPAVRVSATGETGYVFAVGSSGYYIGKRVNGTWTQLAEGPGPFAVGDLLRLEVQAAYLHAWRNNTRLPFVFDRSISAGSAGIWVFDDDPALSLDDWAGGDAGPPAVPTDLVATAVRANQITLTWTDNSSNEWVFQIYRNGGEIARVDRNKVTHHDTTVTPTTSYTYHVQAFNAFDDGRSGYSNGATATTPAPVFGPLATDSFNRDDENPLGGNWTRGGGTFTDLQLVTNAVQGVSAASRGVAYYHRVVWPKDQWSEVRIAGLVATPDGGPSVRISGTSQTGYVFAVANNGAYLIGKRVNGTWTELARGWDSFDVGDLVRLEAKGDTLRAFKNGVLVRSVLDTSIPVGHAGLWIYQNNPALRFDDWAGGVPASPPLVGTIAFTSNAEIYVMNADGAFATRLTDHPASDDQPAWSPEGRWIAFRSERDGNSEVYVMNGDGSAVTRLTDHAAYDGAPAWSPDGGRIAFASDRDGNREIYAMYSDGGSPIRLTNHPAADDQPSWSPDGNHIAFTSRRDGNNEVYVMNIDGSPPTRLTAHPEDEVLPSWSPDGRRVAFVRPYNGIYVMNADGSAPVLLTSACCTLTQYSWSPDGLRIAYKKIGPWDFQPQIYVMDVEGTGLTRLTSRWENGQPSWSAVARETTKPH